MERIFQVFFFTGTLFTVVSFVLGSFIGSDDADVDLDIDTDADVDVDIDGDDIEVPGMSISRVIALKPSTLSAFATVFGGVGMIALRRNLETPRALTWALSLGILTLLILTHLIINPLKRAQNTSAVSQESLIGHEAIVKLAMGKNRFGRVTYTVNGNQYSSPAKSKSGRQIAKGETVTIRAIVKGVFFVDKVKKEDEQCL